MEVNYKGLGVLFHARVVGIRDNGTYDVLYKKTDRAAPSPTPALDANGNPLPQLAPLPGSRDRKLAPTELRPSSIGEGYHR